MAERIIPLSTTLVRYENPVLVTKHEEKKQVLKVTISHSLDRLLIHLNIL